MYKLKRSQKAVVFSFTAVLLLLFVYLFSTATAINNSYNINLIGRKFLASDQSFVYFFISETSILKRTAEEEKIVEYVFDDGVYFITEDNYVFEGVSLNSGQEFYLVNENIYMFIVLD